VQDDLNGGGASPADQEAEPTPRVLLVDDEPANLRLLERTLARLGSLEIRSLSDPRDALDVLERFDPDALLLDLHMPHVDGWSVLEQIRHTRPAEEFLPVIVLTADVSPEARRRSLDVGATDFLTKPLDPSEVALRVRNVLRTRALHVRLHDRAGTLDAEVASRTAELERMVSELRRVDAERRKLLTRLVDAEERQRVELASLVHEDQIQHMTAVGLRLSMIRAKLTEDGAMADDLAELERTVSSSIASLRHLLFELRPPSLDRDGLRVALLEYLGRAPDGGGLDHTVEDRLEQEPPANVRLVVYRVLQEALARLRRSGRARHVAVTLRTRDGGLSATVRHDGASPISDEQDGSAIRERVELAGGWLRTHEEADGDSVFEFWLPM
jgi:DNA-binding response OmpR family regulator